MHVKTVFRQCSVEFYSNGSDWAQSYSRCLAAASWWSFEVVRAMHHSVNEDYAGM